MCIRTLSALLAATVLLGMAAGCDRKDEPAETPADLAELAQDTPPLPHYDIPAPLQQKYPEVVGFLRRFLETCLANDYNGYRAMVSHRFEPETRDRFETMYQAIRSVSIESIEPLKLGALPEPTYRVVSEIHLDPEHPVGQRHADRKIAILVFPEGDPQSGSPWRMVQAPPRLQPALKSKQPTTTAPTSQPRKPDYPWDASGDD